MLPYALSAEHLSNSWTTSGPRSLFQGTRGACPGPIDRRQEAHLQRATEGAVTALTDSQAAEPTRVSAHRYRSARVLAGTLLRRESCYPRQCTTRAKTEKRQARKHPCSQQCSCGPHSRRGHCEQTLPCGQKWPATVWTLWSPRGPLWRLVLRKGYWEVAEGLRHSGTPTPSTLLPRPKVTSPAPPCAPSTTSCRPGAGPPELRAQTRPSFPDGLRHLCSGGTAESALASAQQRPHRTVKRPVTAARAPAAACAAATAGAPPEARELQAWSPTWQCPGAGLWRSHGVSDLLSESIHRHLNGPLGDGGSPWQVGCGYRKQVTGGHTLVPYPVPAPCPLSAFWLPQTELPSTPGQGHKAGPPWTETSEP